MEWKSDCFQWNKNASSDHLSYVLWLVYFTTRYEICTSCPNPQRIHKHFIAWILLAFYMLMSYDYKMSVFYDAASR